MCSGSNHRCQRISAAFPAKPLQPPVTCFRRKRVCSTITAIELHVAAAFAAVSAAKHVQDFHLIPLFSEQGCVSAPSFGTGRAFATKAGFIKFCKTTNDRIFVRSSGTPQSQGHCNCVSVKSQQGFLQLCSYATAGHTSTKAAPNEPASSTAATA